MIWNLLPLKIYFWLPGIFLNFFLAPIRIQTLWIEMAWNFFYLAHSALASILTPYYGACFVITLSMAMDQRDLYSHNNPDPTELLFDFMGWEGMAEVTGPTY